MKKSHAFALSCRLPWLHSRSRSLPPALAQQPPSSATLKDAYGKMFALGTAYPDRDLSDSEKQLLFANFTNITPESCMKPEILTTTVGSYSPIDWLAALPSEQQSSTPPLS